MELPYSENLLQLLRGMGQVVMACDLGAGLGVGHVGPLDPLA